MSQKTAALIKAACCQKQQPCPNNLISNSNSLILDKAAMSPKTAALSSIQHFCPQKQQPCPQYSSFLQKHQPFLKNSSFVTKTAASSLIQQPSPQKHQPCPQYSSIAQLSAGVPSLCQAILDRTGSSMSTKFKVFLTDNNLFPLTSAFPTVGH